MFVGKPDAVSVIPSRSLVVAKAFEKLVIKYNEEKGIEPYDREDNVGFWRIVLYRESKKTKEAMISVVVSDSEVDQDTL